MFTVWTVTTVFSSSGKSLLSPDTQESGLWLARSLLPLGLEWSCVFLQAPHRVFLGIVPDKPLSGVVLQISSALRGYEQALLRPTFQI